MIFGEVGFQKFYLLFKIKFLKCTANGVNTGKAEFSIKSENSQKMAEGRKQNSKMECESRIQKFYSNCKLKFLESTSGTGRHRF